MWCDAKRTSQIKNILQITLFSQQKGEIVYTNFMAWDGKFCDLGNLKVSFGETMTRQELMGMRSRSK